MFYRCTECHKVWSYPVKRCIFCGQEVKGLEGSMHEVVGVTKVHVPSQGHEKVPYFVHLLKDENGHLTLRKSFEEYGLGDHFEPDREKQGVLNIGVVGTGSLGTQLAAYLLQCGCPVVVKTRSGKREETVRELIKKNISRGLDEAELAKALGKLDITTAYSGLAPCDIIIEAAVEDLEVKKQIFRELSKACGRGTVFATNSSSLSVDELAKVSDRPDKVIGMHFFNPVRKMDLVEVVLGKQTSPETRDRIMNFALTLKKHPIPVYNSPGFVVNRLLLPQINEAVRMLEGGIASREAIDTAMKLGLNHPMGPLKLADFIGLDVCLSILEVLAEGVGREDLKPAGLLYEMVEAEKLGYKSGEGFYKY